MAKQQKNFLGIPVTGEIRGADRRVPQRPLEELAPLMQAVLDDPAITWFAWTQYTPYFNDGDPCVFSVSGELGVGVREISAGQLKPATGPSYDDHGVLIGETGNGDGGELDEDDEDDFLPGYFDGVNDNKLLGKRVASWDHEAETHDIGEYIGPDEARYDRCLALEDALGSGAFDDVLLEHFGDHCTVTVTRTGIEVMEFSHD